MKKWLIATAICVAASLVILPLTYGQNNPPAARAQQEKTYQGQLTKVDANAKTISVKGTDDMEMTFQYTDATSVVGSEKNVQGLAGKTGTDLKVTYRTADGKNMATKIEIAEKETR